MHVAPIALVGLGPRSTYRYRYWLVVGTESQIAERFESLAQKHSSERAEFIER